MNDMKRGRPAKRTMTDDERFEEIFFKRYMPAFDPVRGKLVFIPTGKPLTLEESQFLMSKENYEIRDRKTNAVQRTLEPKSLSTMGVQKIEVRALEKARSHLKKKDGATCSADLLDSKDREYAASSQNRLCSEIY